MSGAVRDIGFPYFRYVEPDCDKMECPSCGERFAVTYRREPNGGDLKVNTTETFRHWMAEHEGGVA